MKFTVDSKSFAYALNKCASLAKNSATYPAISNLLIEAEHDLIKVSATDVATYVTYYVDPISVTKTGTALVDAKIIAAFVSAKEGRVDAYLTKANALMVKNGGLKIKLNQSSAEFH